MNKNEDTTYKNQWDAAKAVVKKGICSYKCLHRKRRISNQ